MTSVWAGELRLNPDECYNWGKVAAIVQAAKQSDVSLPDTLKAYQLEVNKNPRNKVEVAAVKHLIKEVYTKFDKHFPPQMVFDLYFSSCMANEGRVYNNTDI